MPASEIRKEAREALKGKWGKAVCIVIVYLAIVFVVGIVEKLLKDSSPALYNIVDLAYAILSVPLSFGIIISFMKLKRGEKVSAFNFFKDGFSRFGKAWSISLYTLWKLILPIICLILIIALMITLYAAAMIRGNLGLSIGLVIAAVALYIATIVYVVSRAFLYVISYNIAYDYPELSYKDVVLKSEDLMRGNRGNYFLLDLSFIGWAILAALTCGIGLLWLFPYMQVAAICFYERVAKVEPKRVDGTAPVEEKTEE